MLRVCGLILCFLPLTASADWISEISVGYKARSSFVLDPVCRRVASVDPRVEFDTGSLVYNDTINGRLENGRVFKCGGDSIIWAGYLIAYKWNCVNQWKFMTCKAGWFHFSSWFDGSNRLGIGDDFEVSFECVCVTAEINWSQMRRRRR